jgi:hypothetical protein
MGESLARYATLLYLTALVQRFQFRAKEGFPPSDAHVEGFTTSPAHFHIDIIPVDFWYNADFNIIIINQSTTVNFPFLIN